MMDFYDRLAPPPTVYPPTQADQGAQLYYQICMVCHGDRGQGLTDEWRGVLDAEDQNCWQSGCHGGRLRADGFEFPHIVPAAVSPGVVARFANALEFHDYIKTKMPWHAPGSRSEEEYWQLTAFLLRANGIDAGQEPLTPQRAAAIRMRPLPVATPTAPGLFPAASSSPAVAWGLPAALVTIGLLLLAFLLVKLGRR
jgi:hypothetical protein